MTDIRDIPIWEDCPFRDLVPKEYVIRRNAECEVISYEPEGGQALHVEVSHGELENHRAAAIRNLGGERFEREYPGADRMFFRQMADGKEPSQGDVKIMARRHELTGG